MRIPPPRNTMREDEVVAFLALCAGALGSDLVGAQGIELIDAAPDQLTTGEAVEAPGSGVGVDDAAAGRIDEQHHRGVLKEQAGEQVLARQRSGGGQHCGEGQHAGEDEQAGAGGGGGQTQG